MRFKFWITPFLNELFVPGTYYNRPQDITNVGMGIRSKYISDEEAGVKPKKKIKLADFGVNTQKEKEKTDKLRKLKRLKAFKKAQRRNL